MVGKERRGVLEGRKYLHWDSHPPKRSGDTRSSSSAAWPGVGWTGRAWRDLPCGSQKLLGLSQTEPWGKTQVYLYTPASLQQRTPSSDAATLRKPQASTANPKAFPPSAASLGHLPAPPTARQQHQPSSRCSHKTMLGKHMHSHTRATLLTGG